MPRAPPRIRCSTEFDRLRDYLELMAIRMGPRLAYTLDLPPDLAEVPVPTLLLQPLVENSIQHGLEPKVEGGRIAVRARARRRAPGAGGVATPASGDAAGAGSGKGFGLAQVRERLAALHGEHARARLRARTRKARARASSLPIA